MQPDDSWDIGGALILSVALAVAFAAALARQWLMERRMRIAWEKAVDYFFGIDPPESEFAFPLTRSEEKRGRKNADPTKGKGFRGRNP